MLDRDHECFPSSSSGVTLWRYLDFTKFVSLLENRELYFSRADQFDDPYEGAYSKAGISLLRNEAATGGFPASAVEQIIRSIDQHRQEMFISCWVAAEYESAAMWKLYLQSSEGVAIKSNLSALENILQQAPLRARATMVKYIDYDTTPVPMNNVFFPFVHKRLSFAHENELRAMIWASEDVNKPQLAHGATHVSVAIEPAELINAIHVSPSAPNWFGQLVEKISKRYGLVKPIIKSGLYDRPTY